jgi:hypothetical protein
MNASHRHPLRPDSVRTQDTFRALCPRADGTIAAARGCRPSALPTSDSGGSGRACRSARSRAHPLASFDLGMQPTAVRFQRLAGICRQAKLAPFGLYRLWRTSPCLPQRRGELAFDVRQFIAIAVDVGWRVAPRVIHRLSRARARVFPYPNPYPLRYIVTMLLLCRYYIYSMTFVYYAFCLSEWR